MNIAFILGIYNLIHCQTVLSQRQSHDLMRNITGQIFVVVFKKIVRFDCNGSLY